MARNSDRTFADLNILVAEDEVINQLVVTKILSDAGYGCHVVSDGCEVIKTLASSKFDLILMDYFLPGMDGVAVTRAIREGQSGSNDPEIPIIALTALNSEEEHERCKAAGMNAFLSKPADPQHLIAAIQRLIGGERGDDSHDGHKKSDIGRQAKSDSDAEHQVENVLDDEVIDKFLQEIPLDVAKLHSSLAVENLFDLAFTAHRLKGAFAYLGASGLLARAARLEEAAKEGNLGRARSLTAELTSELETFLAEESPGDYAAAGPKPGQTL